MDQCHVLWMTSITAVFDLMQFSESDRIFFTPQNSVLYLSSNPRRSRENFGKQIQGCFFLVHEDKFHPSLDTNITIRYETLIPNEVPSSQEPNWLTSTSPKTTALEFLVTCSVYKLWRRWCQETPKLFFFS